MAAYSASINGATASTTLDTVTVVTTATGQGSVVGLYEIFFAGEAGSSSVLRLALDRSTGGTTGSASSLTKVNPASVTQAFSAYTAWVAQPTLSGNRVLTPTFNAYGQQFKWMAAPDRNIVVGGQGAIANLSLRSLSGTPVFSGHILIEEL